MANRFGLKEEYELLDAIRPWTIGYERIGKKIKHILKPDAPREIVKKRDRLWELILADEPIESIEDFSQ